MIVLNTFLDFGGVNGVFDMQKNNAVSLSVAKLRLYQTQMTYRHATGRRAMQLPFAVFLLLVAAYLLPGLIGHDPWKQDETYIFSIVHHLLQSGDWVVPQLVGEPFMEKPPLYYWVAALLAHVFSSSLPLYDGARLATGLFMATNFAAIGLAARHWWGAGHGRIAVLVLMACFGLLYESHIMITDVPMLTGFAIASYGFALSRERYLAGGIWLGTGVGVGFLAKGLLVPGVIGVTAVALPLLFPNWRHRAYARVLLVAAAAALPWLLIWPIALYQRSPQLFYDWFWLNNVGRFLGFSVPRLGASNEPWFWLKTLPWFAFPALPLAMLSVWQQRREFSRSPPLQYGLVAFTVCLAVLLVSASARNAYGLPMLAALAVLAAPAVANLPDRLSRYLDAASRILFTGLACLIWAVWIVLIVTGRAPDWKFLTRALPVDYVMPFIPVAVAAAVLATLAYLLAWVWLPRIRGRAIVSMAAGTTLCWLLLATLWLPWVDAAKSYRSVFLAMQPHLPIKYRCVESVGLGESESAMLLYFSKIRTLSRELHPNAVCDVLLVYSVNAPPLAVERSWRPIWEGDRPGDTRERFSLFVQQPHSPKGQLALARDLVPGDRMHAPMDNFVTARPRQ
ncbi:MAG: glycosyltransferase family 39 protein [Betaproteobacteria bacterium]|nr:glycosyltransferase family 39 protein [Betaproteobacteria bacterium]